MNTSGYQWNVQINVGGTTFTGPGMETKRQAEAIKNLVEGKDDVQKAKVIKQ
ncbi:hypothetical protein [Halopiger xanaduensis]|uniref:BON domain-containing protein n=1 Tax=Halopiger xanaduensis (strain DSM 18323 / JCM 14033 / SH-6) TaxID=797210 RepID=F8DEN9_HALXS|nr:hypothetical protein [Halopiger xanaduensis]AEH39476.1 hypothetical protein Halxa_0236 [Halopiger xanaduensis SH-6]